LAPGPETNITRDDLPVDVLPVLSIDPTADHASPLNVHSDTLPQVCADCFCKFFPYLHSMPFRLRVPFSQAVFIRFIYRDREVGYDAAVFRLSYDGVSAKPTRHVDSIESASSREFAFPLCRAALRSDGERQPACFRRP
jgi:hypothetical protein